MRMKFNLSIVVAFIALLLWQCSTRKDEFDGIFISGSGDKDYLRLIDESYAFLNPNPVVPNVTMLYQPDWDSFAEGAGWGAFWIQNSYGFCYSAAPLLREPWFSILQRSLDLHWSNQGDGKRMSMWGGSPTGTFFSGLVAPDGSLGDMAKPNEIGFKQGDGDQNVHDWFYEATAAGVLMEAEILLVNRDLKAIANYLPRMERACNFIEKARDPKNNLFLVGPACNLLAPSYGGVRQLDGSFGKGYLTGVSVTYLGALDRMVELYKMTGDSSKLEEYSHRRKITRESLALLLTPDGYFVKSMEPGGIMHGVPGQKQFGYLEGVCNADAVAMRVVDDRTANSIYNRIATYPDIRPFDFLLTNAPGLDDTYWSWGNTEGRNMDGFRQYGDWVNGGVWGTVEGRAILMYYRLGKFEDIRKSAIRNLKWSKDFRMDAPWSQRGENASNPWSDTGGNQVGGVAVMIDNFAIPAATIRGLFDYDYRSDRVILRPRIPGSITSYTQKQPVRFGDKQLYLTCRNGGPKVKSVKINGRPVRVLSADQADLLYADLPDKARIEITTTGGWPAEAAAPSYPSLPSVEAVNLQESNDQVSLPDSLRMPYNKLLSMKKLLADDGEAVYEKVFIDEALASFRNFSLRVAMDPGPGYYRQVTPARKEGIERFYSQAALSMYKGFENRMKQYSASCDEHRKKVAALFAQTAGS
jgi:hypothetical protein